MGMGQEADPELVSSCISPQHPFVAQLPQALLGIVRVQRLKGRQEGLGPALQVGSQPSALLPAVTHHQLVARVGRGNLITQARPAPLDLSVLVEVKVEGQGVNDAPSAEYPAWYH